LDLKTQKNSGYTLIELAIVVAILSILAGLGIPLILKYVSLARVDAVKSILNSAASDCLQKVRIGNDPQEIFPSTSLISNDVLGTYGYQIKQNTSTCGDYMVTASSEDDPILFQLGFKISAAGDIVKIAFPSTDPISLDSCKNWAGVNCGVSADQQAIWDALAKIEKDKKTCNDDFYAWLQKPGKPGNGSYKRWDEATKSCSLETWAFEGSIQKDEESYKLAEKAKYGLLCSQKTTQEKDKKTTNGPVKITECGEREFYFCLGDDKGTLEAMNKCKIDNQEAKCASDREAARITNYKGKYGPMPGPGTCGEVRWMCNQIMVESEELYKTTTSCGKAPTCIEPKDKPWWCEPDSDSPRCKCQ